MRRRSSPATTCRPAISSRSATIISEWRPARPSTIFSRRSRATRWTSASRGRESPANARTSPTAGSSSESEGISDFGFRISDWSDNGLFWPLLWAVYKRSPDSTRLLLQNGASVNETNAYGDSPLSVAVDEGRTEIVRELLKFGANVNIKNSEGRALTDVAAERSDWEIVELLKIAGQKP
ncbi:MAG: ankyrin repeat domain-containing protein [Acidobacteria bacterium]|nr:ankyrin repeat domain-containing protein [Acidobacteriota bacterium]